MVIFHSFLYVYQRVNRNNLKLPASGQNMPKSHGIMQCIAVSVFFPSEHVNCFRASQKQLLAPSPPATSQHPTYPNQPCRCVLPWRRLAASDTSDGPIHSKTTNNHQEKGGFAQQKIKILRPIFSLLLAPPFCRWSQVCRTEAEPVNIMTCHDQPKVSESECWEGQPRLISPDYWLAVTVAPGFWWITIKSISKVLKISTPYVPPDLWTGSLSIRG